jgi:digeranylgeranylglycerophospholipid reductase
VFVMETLRCDILVVGAGPAGSSAARAAAGRGLEVLVVERRDTVGVPVQCAEYIPAPLLAEVGLGRGFVVQPVKEMRTVLPDGAVKAMRAPGFMIRRDLFDQSLASAAERQGVRLLASTRVLGVEGGKVVIQRRGEGREKRVLAKVIVGADGPRSTVGRWIGSENRNLIPAVQWRVSLSRSMEHTEVYFHEDFYGGYGWLFPVGREANVGLGRKRRSAHDEGIGKVLERFVSRLVEEGKIERKPLRATAGWIPAEPVRRVTRDNVILVGDAAGHTHPVTGAGVSQAVIGGRMAGRWAARAAETGDLSLLGAYEEEWRERFGEVQERAERRRKSLEKNWDRLASAVRTSWVAFREYYADT